MALKIVITGVSGFLGSAVMHTCLNIGFDTIGVSRTCTSSGNFSVQDYDETPLGDVLVHLAETNDIGLVNQYGQDYLLQTTGRLKRLLAKGYPRVVYASSCAVYGDRTQGTYSESDPVTAANTYTRSKLACEKLVLNAGGVVLRFANIYGPGMSRANVISAILDQIPGDGPVVLRDLEPVRDFVWLDDAATAVCASVADQTCAGVFNVGTGTGVSVRYLAQRALETAGQAGRELVATAPLDRRSRNVLDITRINQKLGWAPAIGLEDGLAMLIELHSGIKK